MTNTASNISSEAQNSVTLPASYYHDPVIYERERQLLFFKEWLLFCHEGLLPAPGHYVAYTIAGRPILVIRGKDGNINAFHNVCRHRASLVVREGYGKTDILRCMYHGWVYDTQGHLCKAPNFGGDERSLCDRTSLFPVHLKIHRGLVFINMSEGEAPDFMTSLGALPPMLDGINIEGFKFFDMVTHTMNCNWKTYIENYMEGYHIPVIHPALNKEIDFSTYKVTPGNRIARHETGLRDKNAVSSGLWVWLWPNAMLNIYTDGMNLEVVIPTGPETVELRYCYLFNDVSPEKEQANRSTIALSKLVTDEDLELCEAVQKNLKAGVYTTGELSPRHETGITYFQDMLRQII